MNLIKLLLRIVFIIKDLLWQRIFDILCINMILLLMTDTSLLTIVNADQRLLIIPAIALLDTLCFSRHLVLFIDTVYIGI